MVSKAAVLAGVALALATAAQASHDPRGVTKYGTAGADTITGTNRADHLYGWCPSPPCSPPLVSGSGDRIQARRGDDFVSIWDASNALVHLGDGDDVLSTYEGLWDNTVYGGDGDDWLEMGGGVRMTAYGQDGADTITDDGLGREYRVYGGSGNDTIQVGGGEDESHNFIDCGRGYDTVRRSDATDTLKGCENLVDGGSAPVADDDGFDMNQGTTLSVGAPGVLADDSGSGLTAVKVSNPGHGTLTLNANGSFTYTPDVGFTGTDTFTYKASNDSGQSNTATVFIAVHASE